LSCWYLLNSRFAFRGLHRFCKVSQDAGSTPSPDCLPLFA
jgi:hypothetical protein